MLNCCSVFAGNDLARAWGEDLIKDLILPAPAHLVLDVPWGYAFGALPTLPRPLLVIALDASPFYVRDILAHSPEGLRTVYTGNRQICDDLTHVARGGRFYLGPRLTEADRLTPAEQDVLRCIAFGMNDAEIIRRLLICKKTLSNRICELCDKMTATSKVQLALRYLGVLPARLSGSSTHYQPALLNIPAGGGKSSLESQR